MLRQLSSIAALFLVACLPQEETTILVDSFSSSSSTSSSTQATSSSISTSSFSTTTRSLTSRRAFSFSDIGLYSDVALPGFVKISAPERYHFLQFLEGKNDPFYYLLNSLQSEESINEFCKEENKDLYTADAKYMDIYASCTIVNGNTSIAMFLFSMFQIDYPESRPAFDGYTSVERRAIVLTESILHPAVLFSYETEIIPSNTMLHNPKLVYDSMKSVNLSDTDKEKEFLKFLVSIEVEKPNNTTSEWQLHTNSKAKFSFEYPIGLDIEDYEWQDYLATNVSDRFSINKIRAPGAFREKIERLSSLAIRIENTPFHVGKYTGVHKRFYKKAPEYAKESSPNGWLMDEFTYLDHNGNIFLFTQDNMSQLRDSNGVLVIDRLLSTFEILE